MPDEVEELIARARRAGWRAPRDDVVGALVEASSADPPISPVGPLLEVAERDGPPIGVRSGAAFPRSGRELYASFEGGEAACLIEEGSVLGSWLLRGTIWLSDPTPGPVRIDWIEDDHVLSSVTVQSGEPFRLEEVAGSSWHLELLLEDGRRYALRPVDVERDGLCADVRR